MTEREVVIVRFGGAGRGREGRLIARDDVLKSGGGVDDAAEIRRNIYRGGTPDAPGITMSATFTRKEVGRLFNMAESRLRYWERSGFIAPSGYRGRQRCYTFQDLISIRSALSLLEHGVSLQQTRQMISQLDRLLPQTPHPLGRLRIAADRSSVTVTDEGREFEAKSGQLVLDFTVKNLEEAVVANLPEYAQKVNSRSAWEWYLEACRLDEIAETMDAAEQAYHQALLLDPGLVNAYTNLGNLRYRRGAREDARALYLKAIEVDERQPEAQYNLGFLDYENDDFENARSRFERVVHLDPTFADAYFNLAMSLFRLGAKEQACFYWSEYVTREPDGAWADTARRFLAELTMKRDAES